MHRFGLVTSLLNHTLDNTTAITRVAMGASIIEKDFTLDRKRCGPEDSFLLAPVELAALCKVGETALEALGRVEYRRNSIEQDNVKFRRSLYFVKDLDQGQVLTADAVRSVRPGFGMAPKHLECIIGKRTSTAVKANTPVLASSIEA